MLNKPMALISIYNLLRWTTFVEPQIIYTNQIQCMWLTQSFQTKSELQAVEILKT